MSWFAVLTAASGISDAAAENLGADWRRLGPNAIEAGPFPKRLELTVPAAADLNWVPAEARQKRLLIADMDSTMISVECVDELADFAGRKAEVAEITERAMQGELDFEGALRARVEMLTGVTEAQIAECLAERVAQNPGAKALIQTMNARGAETILVSGGFTAFAEPVGGSIGFGRIVANVLELEDGKLTGRVIPPIVSADTKLAVLKNRSAALGLSLKDCIAVGDGANDAKMVAAAGLGVAYKAKPALKEVADAAIDHSDLTALLAMQGISTPA